jgi:prophage antirepressor-like protein
MIRAVEIEGEPWFVAKDVCEVLRLSHVSNSLKALSASEITRCNRITLGEKRGGAPMPVISESGLYKLIMRSDKPEAKAF